MDSIFNVFVNLRVPELSTETETQSQLDDDHKCGLEIVNAIVFNFDRFNNDQKLLLKPLLQRPVTETSFVTPGGFFRVHYDLTGPNAPGYNLDLLAEALDSTYKFEIDFLGYNIPPGDSATNPNISAEEYGGDNRYDVYIGNLGSGFYGYTQFEYEVEEGSNRFSSYMMIDNDYSNYYSTGINGARVTVAHEFHHSIQGGNYIFRTEDTFIYEVTSTAMEEFVFDDVNDYYDYMSTYFNSPETPLPLTNGYSTATWNIYLRDNFDYDIIKRQWELMPSVRAMYAINTSIFEYGSSFAREYNRYGIWMYFTNYRAVPGKYFEEGVNYPLVEPTTVVQFTPNSQTLNMSSRSAAHSFITFIVSNNNDSLVAIVSNGDVQNAVTGLNNYFDFGYTLYSDSSSGERYLTENYSSDFEAENPAFWSVSEILNNIIVREDDAINQPTNNILDYAYPSPFEYGKSYLFGSMIFFPISAVIGEAVDFNVYTSGMELVFKSEETVKFLPGEQVGVIWNVMDDKNEKLASGVYIYVIQKGDEITKGKLVILN